MKLDDVVEVNLVDRSPKETKVPPTSPMEHRSYLINKKIKTMHTQ